MLVWFIGFCFFFQAEDGIRDAQESRGLGDVYKRQDSAYAACASGVVRKASRSAASGAASVRMATGFSTVSYTHLTLPTIYSV